MPNTKFTNLDFDQIKTQIKDYLRSNSDFDGFDFDGSNFSVLIDTLAYNTYITAFNSNMIVNESFLDSATLRENVVSLARNIGYTPRSKTAARAEVAFKLKLSPSNPPDTVELRRGLVCVGAVNDSSYTFAISENVTKLVVNEGDALNPSYVANFENLPIRPGYSDGAACVKSWHNAGSLVPTIGSIKTKWSNCCKGGYNQLANIRL